MKKMNWFAVVLAAMLAFSTAGTVFADTAKESVSEEVVEEETVGEGAEAVEEVIEIIDPDQPKEQQIQSIGAPVLDAAQISIESPVINVPTNTRTGVRVSWETVADAARYRIYRTDGPGTPNWRILTEVNASQNSTQTYVDTTATESGAWYAYTVTALSAPDTSGSRKESTRPGGRAVRFLAPPEIVSAAFTGTRVKVIWKTVNGAFKYRLYRKNAGESDFSKVMDVVNKENAYTLFWVDTMIPIGSSCQYYVRVVDGEGTKPYSSFLEPVTVSTGKAVTGISLNISQKTVSIGKSFTLTAAVKPSDATNKKVSWSSSSPDVASVDSSGVVTAQSEGIAEITATAESGEYSASCEVTVLPSYSIIYVLDGGTNASGNPDCYDADTPETALADASRKGYKFSGWYEDSSYTERITEVGGGSAGDLTLYAKWTPYKYTITYVLDGGTNNTANPASYMITDEVIFKNPTRVGYIFEGWYKEAGFVNRVYRIWRGTYGKTSIYAKWKPITYSITFDRSGGIGNMGRLKDEPSFETIDGRTVWCTTEIYTTIDCTFDEACTIPLCDFVRPGYYCTHWNTKADGTGVSYQFLRETKNLTRYNGKTITLYPVWKAMSAQERECQMEVFRIVNQERAADGKAPLEFSEELAAMSQQRAYELYMCFDGEHNRPDGNIWATLLECVFRPNPYNHYGENIAMGFRTPADVMNAWMGSDCHRENILNLNYSEIGVGCAIINGIPYWVQNFGRRRSY